MKNSSTILESLFKFSLVLILVLSFLQVKMKFGWDPIGSFCHKSDSILIESIIVQDSMKIKVNEPRCLQVKIEPANAYNKNLKWFSEDTAVANVDLISGVITPTGVGDSCSIIAAATDGSGKSIKLMIKIIKDTIDTGSNKITSPDQNNTDESENQRSNSTELEPNSKNLLTDKKAGGRETDIVKGNVEKEHLKSREATISSNPKVSVFNGAAEYNQQKRTITIVKEMELNLHKNDGRTITLYPGDIIEGVRVKNGYLKMGELNHNGKMTLLDGLNNKL